MEPKVNYTVVGLFVVCLTVAIVVVAFWLSVGLNHPVYRIYRVNMNEAVTGLSVGSPVKYNGVDVGAVKVIRLNPLNPQEVIVLLNIQVDVPITQGTTATLMTQGITGIAYIGLKSVSANNAPLRALRGQKFPIIPTAPSLLFRLDTAVTQLSTNFSQLTKDFQALLDNDNRMNFKLVLFNMQQITNALSANSKQMSLILQNTSKASESLPLVLQDSQVMMQTLSTQTLPATTHLLNNLNTLTDNLTEVSRSLKRNPSVLLRGEQPAPLGPGEK